MASSHDRPRASARLLLIAFSVAAATAATTAFAGTTHPIALFDRTIAMGLPRTVTLPASPHRDRRRAIDDDLVVEAILDVGLRFPDDVPGTMYLASWRGEPAIVTRSGDHLDISVARSDGVDVTGFSSDTHQSHHIPPLVPAAGVASVPARRTRDDNAMETSRAITLPTLIFWMFMHDDVLDLPKEHIHASYVAWWIADMKRVLPSRSLWILYSRKQNGVTDVVYGTASSLPDWTAAVDAYATRIKLQRVSGKTDYKFMLLTMREPVPGSSGQAWLGGDHAIASLTGRYNIIAHEFGHTLGANHTDAEVRWTSVWPCETNMMIHTSSFRSNCYRYSSANERRMRTHVAREWTVPVNPDPPGIPLTRGSAAVTARRVLSND